MKAILLLLLFSFSLVGNSFELHYCKGELTDVALIGNAACICDGDEVKTIHCALQEKSTCSHSKSESSESGLTKKNCCETSIINVDIDHEFSSVNYTAVVVLIYLEIYFPLYFDEVEEKDKFTFEYVDPALWIDIPINIQTFLI